MKPYLPSSFIRVRSRQGFTLIELLTVIAVMGILAAILFPVVNGAREAGMNAKSKAQFAQWKAAIESFRQEYGYYPFIQSGGDTEFEINASGNRDEFEGLLDGSDLSQNRRGIPFYRLTENDLEDPNDPYSDIVDAFGNNRLYVLIDSDRDGVIRVGGYEIRSSVEIVALADDANGYPRITSWIETD